MRAAADAHPIPRIVPGRARSWACPALALCVAASGRVVAQGWPLVSEVEIRPTNVFSAEEAARKFFLYRFANALHIVTKTSFVDRQLLFRPGDPLRPEILAETERNLRAFGLFRKASVRAEGTRVVVDTADAWTLLLRGSLSNKGGVTEYSVGVEEYNLVGLGMQFGFGYAREADRVSRSLFFAAPDLLAPHAAFRMDTSDLSDGQRFSIAYGRPFYALQAPWALEGLLNRSDFDTKLYAGGEEVATWLERERRARVSGGALIAGDASGVERLIGSIEWNEVRLRESDGPPPPDSPASNRRYLFVSAGFERIGAEWITRRQVDQIERDEDFNLATGLHVEAGISPGFDTRGTAGQFLVNFHAGTSFPMGFALFTSTGSTRLESGFQNATVSADARGYALMGPWTLVGRIGTFVGWRLDPENQIALDGLTGVRGYRLHAVEGNRRLVANAEARVLLVPEIFSLFSFGIAAFGDAGYSWGAPDGFWHLADAGVGLRIGITRASKNSLLRLDVARVLHPDPIGRTGWLVSFSSGQAF